MRTFSFCGTIEYMSPELIKGGIEGHDFSVDWWSVGVLTYELLTGASPFTVDGERNTQAEISKRILRNQPPIPDHLSAQARDFIRRLLVKEPSKRLGGRQSDANQLKSHPFLSSIDWNLLAQRKLKAPFKPKVKHELDVSNFADEFTSMAPHVLVSSSNNQINSASIIDDSDGSYESDDFDDDDDKTNQTGQKQIKDNEFSDASSDCDDYFGDTNKDTECYYEFSKKDVAHHERSLFGQKAFPSSFPSASLKSNGTVISTFINSSVISGKNSAAIDINSTSKDDSKSHLPQVFSLLTPSKHQLSFSLLARQQQERQQFYVPHKSDNDNHSTIELANNGNNNIGQISVNGRNDLVKHLHAQLTTLNNNQAQQQYHNEIHFSKLFKGYSYINPKAVEWLKQQDRKKLSKSSSRSNNTINYDRKISDLANYSSKKLLKVFPSCNELNDDQAFKQNPLINKQNELDDIKGKRNIPTRGAKAIPIEDVFLTYDSQISCYDDKNNYIYDDNDDDEKFSVTKKTIEQQSKSEQNFRVAFTIGDGEDLYAAVRSAGIAANKQAPERLVVAKRKPSLELLYERHANQQILAQSSNNYSTSRVVTTTLPFSINPINSTTALKQQQQSKMQTKTNIIRPKVGSILFDPQCNFFKIYHLVNPINSKKDLLGEGAFSICKRCVHKETGKEYAVKIMSSCLETSREIEMLRRCQDHPNVVKLYDVFQDSHNSYMVFELLKGGELLSRIRGKRRNQTMSERDVCRIFRSLVSTVDYLHSQRIVHRDLKPENLLFIDSTPSSGLKLIDFGFARELPEMDSGNTMQSPCITLDYCAPEVLNQAFPVNYEGQSNNDNIGSELNGNGLEKPSKETGYDESCDLWSLGVILYAMLSGRLPFSKDQLTPTEPLAPMNAENIRSRTVNFSGSEWTRVSQAPRDIILGLLNPDPSKRLTIQNLVHNDWLMNFDSTEIVPKRVKTTKRKSPSEASKNPHPITMTLRKRATLLVNPETKSSTSETSYKQQKLKRSLDNDHHPLNSSTLTSDTSLSANKTKRPKLNSGNKVQPNEQLDSKWLGRFVQIDRANKDSLRITFRALNNQHDSVSVADSRNGFSLDSQRSNASYELADTASSPSSSPTSIDFTIANGVVNSSSSNVASIYTAVAGKHQVKRLKLHNHDRSSAGSTGTTIYTKSTDFCV